MRSAARAGTRGGEPIRRPTAEAGQDALGQPPPRRFAGPGGVGAVQHQRLHAGEVRPPLAAENPVRVLAAAEDQAERRRFHPMQIQIAARPRLGRVKVRGEAERHPAVAGGKAHRVHADRASS